MSQSIKDPEKIKKIESISWKGPESFDVKSDSISDTYNKELKNYLLKKGTKGLNLKGKTVINVGGGHGEEAEFLIKKGVEKVLLIDIAPGQIESAKIRKREHGLYNLFVKLGDAEDLDYNNNEFDLGFIYMALHHFPSHEKGISEICKVSKHVIFIDIMNSELTKFLGLFGLFREEGCGIRPNRLNKEFVNQIFEKNCMDMKIEHFFFPPYYGNSVTQLKFLKLLSGTINRMMRFGIMARIFGNIAIIKGNI